MVDQDHTYQSSSSKYSPNNHDNEADDKTTKERPLSTTTTVTTTHSHPLQYQDGPTPLNFSLATGRRKQWAIALFALFFIEAGVLPLILFYSLLWGAHLSITKNLAIITSLVGTFSGFKLAHRTYLLWFRSKHESRRPIGAGRWGMDFFNVLANLAMAAFFIPLIIGSSLSPASTSTVAMALPCMMLTLCIPLLITGVWFHQIRVPFRVSSLPPKAILPPLTYTIVEDVCAVDGGGLMDFRQAWRHRYEESGIIRKLCRDTAVAWGASGIVVAIGLIFAAWFAPTDTGYGLSYGIPWAWAFSGTGITIWWTNKELARELREWDKPSVHRERPLKLVEDEDARAADQRVLARKASRAATIMGRDSTTSNRPGSPPQSRLSQQSGRRSSESAERPSVMRHRSSARDRV